MPGPGSYPTRAPTKHLHNIEEEELHDLDFDEEQFPDLDFDEEQIPELYTDRVGIRDEQAPKLEPYDEHLLRLDDEITEAINTGDPGLADRLNARPLHFSEDETLVRIISQQIATLIENPIAECNPAVAHCVLSSGVRMWAMLILNLTDPQIKSLLSQDRPPSPEEFKRYKWTDSREFGVYGCMLVPEEDGHNSHLYVGSATGNNGLQKRRQDRQSLSHLRDHPSWFHNLILDDVDRHQAWVTIILIPGSQDIDDPYERLRNRVICLLAETLFTCLLRGFYKPELNDLSPIWRHLDHTSSRTSHIWHGLCSQIPIAAGFLKSVSYNLRKARVRRAYRQIVEEREVLRETLEGTELEDFLQQERARKIKAAEASKERRRKATNKRKHDLETLEGSDLDQAKRNDTERKRKLAEESKKRHDQSKEKNGISDRMRGYWQHKETLQTAEGSELDEAKAKEERIRKSSREAARRHMENRKLKAAQGDEAAIEKERIRKEKKKLRERQKRAKVRASKMTGE